MSVRVLAALCLCACALPVSAASAGTCAAVFESLGRSFVADAPGVPEDAGPAPLDCSPAEGAQLVTDARTLEEAVPAESREALIGVWVSDDVAPALSGDAPPVFTALDIAGSGEDGIRMALAAIRGVDPAEAFATLDPPVDVEEAGPFAMLGRMRAVPAGEGAFAPVWVRYRDLPLDTDRTRDLTMRLRMPSFYQSRPLGFAVAGDRLVLTAMDRGAARRHTYRRHDTEALFRAMVLARAGEMPFAYYPCLLRAVTDRRAAYAAMVDGFGEEAFFEVLEEGVEAGQDRLRLADLPEEERPAAAQALAGRLAALAGSPEMTALRTEAAKARPFGCVAGE